MKGDFIQLHETHAGAWLDVCDQEKSLCRLRAVLGRLTNRGWAVQRDPHVEANYASIAYRHYVAQKGDLRISAEANGRVFSVTFFEEEPTLAPASRSFSKFGRMSKLVQLAFAVEMTHVLRHMMEMGYTLRTSYALAEVNALTILRHAQGRTHEGDPLGQFNEQWTPERFARDESGWPTAEEMYADRRRDRDGLPIEVGSVMYARDRGGRLFRGIARPLPNEQWALLSNGRRCDGYITARDLFRSPDGEPRRFIPGQSDRVMRELENALKSKKLRRVEVLARTARLLSDRSAA